MPEPVWTGHCTVLLRTLLYHHHRGRQTNRAPSQHNKNKSNLTLTSISQQKGNWLDVRPLPDIRSRTIRQRIKIQPDAIPLRRPSLLIFILGLAQTIHIPPSRHPIPSLNPILSGTPSQHQHPDSTSPALQLVLVATRLAAAHRPRTGIHPCSCRVLSCLSEASTHSVVVESSPPGLLALVIPPSLRPYYRTPQYKLHFAPARSPSSAAYLVRLVCGPDRFSLFAPVTAGTGE
ncbi:hypothetical protein VTJ04DRAFT_291 [Mycothermus thermophilus]|uniref:uncharacterized protein n=1 Tax=Humicola insolens TaxID=85995 RepID=UPI00374494B0